ncbi:MAG TPA: hypothetical protein ENL34_01945 [Chloroflexi bacterium]|nr:hypothetical protein [Chloroflexota bacterium]
MITPELGRAGFRIAFFMILVSCGLLLLTQPGSAEFVVSSVALGIGLVFALAIVVLVRRSVR